MKFFEKEKVRIATKKTDGTKHIVNFLDFNRNVVRVNGPVVRANGTDTYHESGETLPLEDVEISTVERTLELIHSLVKQTVNQGIDEGRWEYRKMTGRNNKKYHVRPVKSKEEMVVAEKDLKLVLEMALKTIKEDPENNTRLCMHHVHIITAAEAANRNDIIAEFSTTGNHSGSLIDAIENAYCIL